MRRIKIELAYDGTNYYGWQVQPGRVTIQSELQRVLSEIEDGAVAVHGSGRTDAGVHALGQVAAFSIENPIPCDNLRRAINHLLPRDIRVLDLQEVPFDFHPRFAARRKTYEYRIQCSETCSPFERLYVHHYPYPLDVENMIAMAPILEGEHDFTAFSASDEKDHLGRSKVRCIWSSRLQQQSNLLVYRVSGSGFLKHMVRNIAGVLLEAGKGNVDQTGMEARISPNCRVPAGPTAPARGLFLVSVEY